MQKDTGWSQRAGLCQSAEGVGHFLLAGQGRRMRLPCPWQRVRAARHSPVTVRRTASLRCTAPAPALLCASQKYVPLSEGRRLGQASSAPLLRSSAVPAGPRRNQR